ncbi:MAG TPA: LmeA family phospholipid-binding protein [Solirubrobacteraceae bacterium]|nr:LmeA family phospholipid-binding protein [Solirubrobacteraceae bacterium]
MTRGVKIALWVAGVIVVLLALAQIFLPKIAASRISSRIGKYGSVDDVHVSAWPAVKLLWKHADTVRVHASHLRITPAQTAKLLGEARGIDHLDLTVAGVQEGPLAVSDVSFHKRGGRLSAQAHVSEAAVQAALPPGFSVQLLGSSGGKVQMRASGGLFGVGASVNAIAEAREGKLVVHPQGALIEALRITVFANPRVYVTGVSAARDAGSGGEAGYLLGIAARLR